MPAASWFVVLIFALTGHGVTADSLGQCEQAFRKTPDDYEAARCFLEVGRRGQRDRAIAELDRLRVSYPDAPYLIVVRAHFKRSAAPQEALEDYEVAARAFANRDHFEGEIVARANRRSLLFDQGRYPDARHEVDRIEELGRRSDDPIVWARAEVVAASHDLGLHEDVGAAYVRLLAVERRADLRLPYAIERELILARAGAALLLLEFSRAKADYLRLANLAEQRGDPSTIAIARYGMAYSHQVEQELHPSADTNVLEKLFHEAIVASQRVENVALEAQALESLVLLLASQPDRHFEALRHATRCMQITEKAKLTDLLGMCHLVRSQVLAREDPSTARNDASTALEILSNSGQLWQRVAAWRHVMRRTWEQRPVSEALITSDAALAAIEHLRGAQRGQIERRQLFATWTLDYYWLSSRLLERADEFTFLQSGFSVMERSRARVLLDHLVANPSDVDRNPRITPQVTELTQVQHQLLHENDDSRRRGLLERLESLELQVSLESPVPPSKAREFGSIADVQKWLEPDEGLIAYQIGPLRGIDGEAVGGSWALVITKDKAWPVRLSWDRERAESAVRVIRGLIARRDGSERDATNVLLRQLVDPVVSRIPESVKRIILVPDGPLYGVPFATLFPRTAISLTPSATVWLHLRRNSKPGTDPQVLAMVDPEVVPDDPAPAHFVAFRSALGLEVPELGRLPHSLREARALRESFTQQVEVISGVNATEEALKERWSSRHSVLHLGAHAVIDSEHPERSAVILGHETKTQDGLLQTREISAMPFAGATVVLSGCATAWGTSLPGEGVLSLARAFHQAGARAVIASLWPVRDDEAASLFELFYAHMGRGLTLDAALARAQREIARSGAPTSAYAGFVLIGDGNVRFRKSKVFVWRILAWTTGLLALCSIGLGIRSGIRRVRAPYKTRDPHHHTPRS